MQVYYNYKYQLGYGSEWKKSFILRRSNATDSSTTDGAHMHIHTKVIIIYSVSYMEFHRLLIDI